MGSGKKKHKCFLAVTHPKIHALVTLNAQVVKKEVIHDREVLILVQISVHELLTLACTMTVEGSPTPALHW